MKGKIIYLGVFLSALGLLSGVMFSAFNTTSASANVTPEYLLQWGTSGSGDRQFDNPVGITVDANGYIYVVDSHDDDGGNNRIQKFDSNGNLITKWWTSGTSTRQLQSAKGIAVDSLGNVYVSTMNSTGVYHILKFNQSGNFIAKLGDPTTGLGYSGSGFTPFNIAVSSDGSIYAAYSGVNKIVKFSNSGTFMFEWGMSGSGDGQFSAPRGIAVDSNNNVYVADSYNSRVQKFDSNGSFLTKWGTRGNGDGQFTQAYGIYIDSTNDVYVTSAGDGNESVQKFSSSGVFISRISNGTRGSANGQFSYPEGIAVDGVKNIYVADTNNARIQKFDGKTGAGPVAYWDFNDGSGNILSDKIGSNNGTVYGATWNDGALSFNGTSNYVKVPDDNTKLNPTSAITISLWIKPTTLQGIALNKELQYRLIAEDVNTSKPSARIRTANTNWGPIQGQSNLVTNSWQYVALTYNGSKLRIYYNGQLDTEISGNGLIASSYSDDGNLYFGHIGPNRGRNNDLFFKGSIDDIRIYDRALSASEVSSEYNSGRTTPPLCTSWTYSEWSACSVSGQQTRSIISLSPNGCIGGSPALERGCTYIPSCTTDSWQCSDWGSCSVEGKQSRTCNKTAACDGGVAAPSAEKSCTYVPPVCSSWTYSEWSACSADGKQIRSVMSALPLGCTGGTPIVSQSCTYIPPCTEDKWECEEWNQCTLNGSQVRSCIRTFDCPSVNTPTPSTVQTCTPPKPSCTEDKWECDAWNVCSIDGVQSRSCRKVFDCMGVESALPPTAQYCQAPQKQQQKQTPPPEPDEILDQGTILKASVRLICPFDRTRASHGSGTVISSSGVILTNKHVVNGTLGCFVGFINKAGDEPYFSDRQVAYITKTSSDEDIATLQLENFSNRNIDFIDITHGNSSNLKLGTRMITYGYPPKFGKTITFTSGDFSGYDGNYLKTTAILEHGNSGGGAYLSNGTIIGVPTAVIPGELNSMGLVLSINKINNWLNNSSLAYSPRSSNEYSRVSSILDTFDIAKAELQEAKNVRVIIYEDTKKEKILPNLIGAEYSANNPLFVLHGEAGINGFYVYFGDQLNADPETNGTFIAGNEYAPHPLSKDGAYYLIVKVKDKRGIVSASTLTAYQYKAGQKVEQKTEYTQKKSQSTEITKRLRGNILLKVESHGEAYYVNPDNAKRYYLGRPADSFQIMRELGLGASHDFVVKYRSGAYPDNVIGKILIDVGDSGKAYYIYPKNKKAYYLGRPTDAFKVMRELGLGISNSDLEKIVVN